MICKNPGAQRLHDKATQRANRFRAAIASGQTQAEIGRNETPPISRERVRQILKRLPE